MLVEATRVGLSSDHGSIVGLKVAEEEITLSTGGITTDSTANLLAAGAIILAVSVRVTTAFLTTNATGFSVGDASTPARFCSGVGITLGANKLGQDQMEGDVATAAAGPTQATAAKIRLTLTGGGPTNPTAGKARLCVLYLDCQALVN